jgi:Fur family ferric uptake transcriptional regulator/Fur family peroxide stress response transcriptional regulator
MDKYVSILRDRDITVTPQRIAVLRYLDHHRTHPDADTIYEELKQDNPSLSKTTIYNTLDMLRQHDLVKVLTIGTKFRYDFNLRPHHHFRCRRCGAIIDIPQQDGHLDCMDTDGHRIDEVHVYLKGICKTCLHKEKEENNG